jgi:hypothetical protein
MTGMTVVPVKVTARPNAWGTPETVSASPATLRVSMVCPDNRACEDRSEEVRTEVGERIGGQGPVAPSSRTSWLTR